MKNLFKFASSEDGNISALMAVSLTTLAVTVSVGLDMTNSAKIKSNLQDAVDNAVLAGILEDGEQEKISSAKAMFVQNFDEETLPNVSVTDSTLSMNASFTEDRMFPVFGPKQMTISAEATASVKGQEPCIYILDPSGWGAFNMSSSGTLRSQCPIQVNSNSSGAMTYSGNGTYDVIATNVVGTARVSSTRPFSSPPKTGVSVIPDPLLDLQAPDTATIPCDYTNVFVNTASTVTLQPGVYCGGLQIFGSGTVNLAPGQYVMRNGDFRVSLSGRLRGEEMMIILEGNSAYNVSSSGRTSLSAQTSGEYKDILVYQSRDGYRGVNFNLSLSGYDNYRGKFYAPRANIIWSISGYRTQPSRMPLIANRVSISLSGNVTFDYETAEIRPKKTIRLSN